MEVGSGAALRLESTLLLRVLHNHSEQGDSKGLEASEAIKGGDRGRSNFVAPAGAQESDRLALPDAPTTTQESFVSTRRGAVDSKLGSGESSGVESRIGWSLVGSSVKASAGCWPVRVAPLVPVGWEFVSSRPSTFLRCFECDLISYAPCPLVQSLQDKRTHRDAVRAASTVADGTHSSVYSREQLGQANFLRYFFRRTRAVRAGCWTKVV